MPKYPRQKGKPVNLPIYAGADNVRHNVGIYHAIGVLVITWGSAESVFLAILQALMKGAKGSAIITWLSFRNTANRVELVRRLIMENITDAQLRADAEAAIIEFNACTKTRNFFCHAAYGSQDDGRLAMAHSISLSDGEEPLIRDASRLLDRAALNDVVETARRLADMNDVLWDLVMRIEDALEVPSVMQHATNPARQRAKDGPAGPEKEPGRREPP